MIRGAFVTIQDALSSTRARLLVGFAGAVRRAELAAIRVEHLEASERGLRLTLPQGDRTGSGVVMAIPYGATELCPVRAVRSWQESASRGRGVPAHLCSTDATPARRRPLPSGRDQLRTPSATEPPLARPEMARLNPVA